MDRAFIENEAMLLLQEIWRNKNKLSPDMELQPIELLQPEFGAYILGIDIKYFDTLGTLAKKENRYEIAGLLDRQDNKIALSQHFSTEEIRFTAAHELGHWILHTNEKMHRDRPIGFAQLSDKKQPKIEQEANHFAACFLMPRNLLKTKFEETFKTKAPMTIDDSVAFALQPDDHYSLLRPDSGSLTCELAVASATTFNRRHIKSLAKQFRVSATAMAIRLQKLELIRY